MPWPYYLAQSSRIVLEASPFLALLYQQYTGRQYTESVLSKTLHSLLSHGSIFVNIAVGLYLEQTSRVP